MNSLINIALSQFDIKEYYGEKDNPEIIKYFDALGFDGAQLKDETAWCAAFANWVCKQAGFKGTNKLNARSFLCIGKQVTKPKIGDIVVLSNNLLTCEADSIPKTKVMMTIVGGQVKYERGDN